jgi:hypothetical protein
MCQASLIVRNQDGFNIQHFVFLSSKTNTLLISVINYIYTYNKDLIFLFVVSCYIVVKNGSH